MNSLWGDNRMINKKNFTFGKVWCPTSLKGKGKLAKKKEHFPFR